MLYGAVVRSLTTTCGLGADSRGILQPARCRWQINMCKVLSLVTEVKFHAQVESDSNFMPLGIALHGDAAVQLLVSSQVALIQLGAAAVGHHEKRRPYCESS